MTGTERAAMRLALGMLRSQQEWRWHEIANVLEAGGVEDRGPGLRRFSRDDHTLLADRLMTVRVALYLRAVLRADAGDRGRWWVGRRESWPYGGPPLEWQVERCPPPAVVGDRSRGWKAQPGDTYRLAVPLWSQVRR